MKRLFVHSYLNTTNFPVFRHEPRFRCWRPGYESVTVDFSEKIRAGNIYREFDLSYMVGIRENLGLQRTNLTVNPTVENRAVPEIKGISQCSTNSTADICQRECRIKSIQKRCNCTPLTAPSQQLSIDASCLIDHYEICMSNFTGSEDTNCASQCLDSCIYWRYDVEKPPTPPTALDGCFSDMVVFEIQVASFDYQVFEESADWSFVTVIGVIGGAIQFWLGLDIITIVYTILVTPVLFLIDKKFPKAIIPNEIETRCNTEQKEEKRFFSKFIFALKKEIILEPWDIRNPEFVKLVARKLIWSVLFLIGAGFTIQMFLQLYQQYESGGTHSNITVMFNKTMTLPSSALCFPVSGYGWEFNIYGTAEPSDFYDFIEQPNLTKEEFLGNHTWPSSVTFMALMYLEATFRMATGMEYDLSNPDADPLKLNALHNLMLRLTITNEELEQKLGHEYMTMNNISAHCDSSFAIKQLQLTSATLTIEKTPLSEDFTVFID
jgi:hypothetical protein